MQQENNNFRQQQKPDEIIRNIVGLYDRTI